MIHDPNRPPKAREVNRRVKRARSYIQKAEKYPSDDFASRYYNNLAVCVLESREAVDFLSKEIDDERTAKLEADIKYRS